MSIRNFSIIAHINHGKSTLADRFLELTGAVAKRDMREQVLDRMDLERERGITIKMQPCTLTWHLPSQEFPISNFQFPNKSKNQKTKSQAKEFTLNLIDTPGHMDFAYEVERSLSAVEGAVLLVDVTKGVQAQTLACLRLAQKQDLSIVPVINKIDICPSKERLNRVKQELSQLLSVPETKILAVSAKTGLAVEKVLQAIVQRIPGPKVAITGKDDDLLYRKLNKLSFRYKQKGVGETGCFPVSENRKRAIASERQKPRVSGNIVPSEAQHHFSRRKVVLGEARPMFQALVFDSYYDSYLGAIAFVRVFTGYVKTGQPLLLLNQKIECQAKEIGLLKPNKQPQGALKAGEVGYIATGIKEPSQLQIGETISCISATPSQPLPGYQKQNPQVFANLFPSPGDDFSHLKACFEKLRLNDASLDLKPVSHPYLGRGLKAGFLGMLHLEISLERLKREYQTEVIATAPSVVYRAVLEGKNEPKQVSCAVELPDKAQLKHIEEPWVKMRVITPVEYQGQIHNLVQAKRGVFLNSEALNPQTLVLVFKAPLAEIIGDFLDNLKSATQGFASFSYQFDCYQKSDLVKLEFLVAGKVRPLFSRIVHKNKTEPEARRFLKRLKQILPQQNFAQALQARVEGRIIARQDIRAQRKDVTAGLYGGDFSRKKKLLTNQRQHKKKMAKQGRITIPDQVYLRLLSNR